MIEWQQFWQQLLLPEDPSDAVRGLLLQLRGDVAVGPQGQRNLGVLDMRVISMK